MHVNFLNLVLNFLNLRLKRCRNFLRYASHVRMNLFGLYRSILPAQVFRNLRSLTTVESTSKLNAIVKDRRQSMTLTSDNCAGFC